MQDNFKPQNYVWQKFRPKRSHAVESFGTSKIYSILSGWFCKQISVKYLIYVNAKLLQMVQINHDHQEWDKTDSFRGSCFWFKIECKWHEQFCFRWPSIWNDPLETKISFSEEIVHPRLFHMGAPPPLPGKLCFLTLKTCQFQLNTGVFKTYKKRNIQFPVKCT